MKILYISNILHIYTSLKYCDSIHMHRYINIYIYMHIRCMLYISIYYVNPSLAGALEDGTAFQLTYILHIPTHQSVHELKTTLPETNSSPLKMGHPKRKQSYSNHSFSGAFAVSFREGIPQQQTWNPKIGGL